MLLVDDAIIAVEMMIVRMEQGDDRLAAASHAWTSLFWGPMAIAIMGGLAVATLLTLFFVPALYALWFRVRPAASRPALRLVEEPLLPFSAAAG